MVDIKVPELAESVTEGTIVDWLKKEGEAVSKGEPLVEIETDKINLEINSDYTGILKEFLKQPGDTIEVGEVIARLDENADASEAQAEEPSQKEEKQEAPEQKQEKQPEPAPAKAEKEETQQKDDENEPIASPAARKKARELGIDLRTVKTRDPLGRIRPEDVQAAASEPEKPARKQPEPAGSGDQEESGKPVERQKMSRRRQTIAKRLMEAQQNSAMLTTFNEIDMSAVMELRKRRKQSFLDKHDVRLGFMSFFTKAVVGALKQFPLLNAEIQDDEILIKKFYDIGIAVAAKEGLVVPVIRDADRKSFAEIERDIGELAEKAQSNKLSLSELQGGSFSITNGGVFGSLFSTPILNTPQVGILGMHTIQKRPVVVNDETDEVEVRPMMYIALSYDHRIVDGSEAVQFLGAIKAMIEDPENLLLEG
ncbi:2-oxoglutarate dehydrogenase complex dihydrolipoyllysine-residue succinyltransferase [Bacillus marinisedimentorum]|uniref:2-oxoglutarate dehydrogenase complex dihydrolipoyllysine-residue succinyltransferase n=1 Tax=Bacillus marinisedimentorum TaxID=1821260 RepID=UPI000871E1E9|nr:2-oxoglutarate dehydrogenase complex dihydrolipoyllysine-residue succinyltransferase [Bacillus marinisedimentorum]